MIALHFSPDPNPMKVVLALEEMALEYRIEPVNLLRGEQHTDAFRSLNPNGKVPVLVDGSDRVFDSSAILLHLSERTGLFGGTGTERSRTLSWLMFIGSGVGPFVGQAVHFRHFAGHDIPYAQTRYTFEANRHFDILEQRLAEVPFLSGESYSIADMAAWPWIRLLPFALGDDALSSRPNLQRFLSAIEARPAAQRALAVKQLHETSDEIDDRARAAVFPHLTGR